MSVVISGPFIGQIVLFAGNFAPQGWALCGGQPHNNMQPYLGVNFIIAIQAVYPSA